MIENNNIELVCSSFVIFIYQIALDLNGLNVDEYLPFDAKGCYPRDMLKLIKKYPKYWSLHVTGGISLPNYNNIEWGHYNDFYPLMKNISPYRYHLTRLDDFSYIEHLIKRGDVNSCEFKYVPMDNNVSQYGETYE